jgi:hypothetical protein
MAVERKPVAKGKPFQTVTPQYQLPKNLVAETVKGEELSKVKTNSRYKNAAPVSDTALAMSAKMLADPSQGQRVSISKEFQDQKALMKQRLQLDLSRVLTRNGHNHLSVRCIDEGSSLLFYFEPKRVQTPKAKTTDLTEGESVKE